MQKELIDLPGSSYLDVVGKPIKPTAKPGIALDKALVCTAVLLVSYKLIDGTSDWELRTFEVYEVKTPGAEWRKAVGDDD